MCIRDRELEAAPGERSPFLVDHRVADERDSRGRVVVGAGLHEELLRPVVVRDDEGEVELPGDEAELPLDPVVARERVAQQPERAGLAIDAAAALELVAALIEAEEKGPVVEEREPLLEALAQVV